MISYTIQTSSASTVSFVSTAKMTDRSAASACTLGFSAAALLGTGLPATGLPVAGISGLGEAARKLRNERPTKALEAVAAGKATVYGFAATGAGKQQTTTHHHKMWAFRGLEPWSDPV
ncbi:hypothetical protein R6L23_26105 [Streptomyces sp. SR27]|uniref:hypothetical protein n=1 Tax=Streptomyces sp. SR27 TaxID=3076630 RepID=UPI00295BBF6A|nr:hypothetical protein [Streptomyces sp. SR27]MDV9191640.1 hypothetical protein [Streptomyces sp. SR27]